MDDTVETKTLIELAKCGVICEALICRHPAKEVEKWMIKIKFGNSEKILRSKREKVRAFHTIDTASKTLRDMGINTCTLDMN
ncbi:hypothetical protein [Pseudoalteromonas sp. MMG024]|uniref:hypothetical protein n=1 Tax=Pseudoalteromonas sp. MMG024 TaxID=2909980 RepID=UPI001F2A12E5|nr:hypothetical protein [Pseudoalteromonas sp. MMG024]MCF6458733.1 hypothetical protein [Pseudoalteromonas sp. MMG024]